MAIQPDSPVLNARMHFPKATDARVIMDLQNVWADDVFNA
jgi:hypothetical protein